MNKSRFLTQAAMIAAIYVVLVEVLKPISYGIMQIRVAEILTVLPYFTPAAIPGLTLGAFISNMIGPYGFLDILVGSLATFIASVLTYKVRKRIWAPLPAIIVNAVLVGGMLYYIFLGTPDQMPLYAVMAWVALGQTVVCYGLGYPFMLMLEKYKKDIFKS